MCGHLKRLSLCLIRSSLDCPSNLKSHTLSLWLMAVDGTCWNLAICHFNSNNWIQHLPWLLEYNKPLCFSNSYYVFLFTVCVFHPLRLSITCCITTWVEKWDMSFGSCKRTDTLKREKDGETHFSEGGLKRLSHVLTAKHIFFSLYTTLQKLSKFWSLKAEKEKNKF